MQRPLNPGDRRALLSLARLTLQTYVKTGRTPDLTADSPALCQEAGVFVTLYTLGRPRGQTGVLPAEGPLYRSVLDLVISAAGDLDASAPIDASELHQTRIEIAVADEPAPVHHPEDIIVGQHGLFVPGDPPTALLPEAAVQSGWGALEFLEAASVRAGLSRDGWRSKPVYCFTLDRFSEEEIE